MIDERLEQIRKAHASARPTRENSDLGYVLQLLSNLEIDLEHSAISREEALEAERERQLCSLCAKPKECPDCGP